MGITGPVTGKGRGWRKRGKQQGGKVEKADFLGNVEEYWGFYAGEGADTVWGL